MRKGRDARRRERRERKKRKKKDDDDDDDEEDDSTYHLSPGQGDEDEEWLPVQKASSREQTKKGTTRFSIGVR